MFNATEHKFHRPLRQWLLSDDSAKTTLLDSCSGELRSSANIRYNVLMIEFPFQKNYIPVVVI